MNLKTSIEFDINKGVVTGKYQGYFWLNDEPVAAAFGFCSTLVNGVLKDTTLSNAVINNIDILPIIAKPTAWAAVEDDIDMEVYHELDKCEQDEPAGEGYHQAVAA